MHKKSKAMIIILSSPSGGGKTTISKEILDTDKNIMLSISATTRKPRIDEKEAVDYYFKTFDEFNELKNSGEFLEYAEVYGNFYGTLKSYVNQMLNSGYDVLFDIDHQGASQIKEKMPDQVLSIFITPPTIDSLRKRLEKRAQDSETEIENRLKLASEAISHSKNYDYVVVNDDLQEATAKIKHIIEQERLKRSDDKKK